MNHFGASSQEEMMTALLQNLESSDDPYTKLLGQMMYQNLQNNEKTAAPHNPNQNKATSRLQRTVMQDVRTLIRMNKTLIEDFKQLQSDFDRVQQVNAYAASALGACECWGQDKSCLKCGGEGIPGSREMDASGFALLMQPLFKQLMHSMELQEAQS